MPLFESLGFGKGKAGEKPLFSSPEEYLRIKKWDEGKMDQAQALFDAMSPSERARYTGIGADTETQTMSSWHAPKEDAGGLDDIMDSFAKARRK